MIQTLDLSCPCGATMHYVGDLPIGHRAAFLAAHERCRVSRSTAVVAVKLDTSEIQRSLLKLKRRNGGRSLGLS